jgi:rhodanese-related sulfurtransferase
MTYRLLSPQNLEQINLAKSLILDVRGRLEHKEKHLTQPHINTPLDELDAKKFIDENCAEEKTIFILCGGGTRARKAADKFYEVGYKNVEVIDGGIRACEACGQRIQKQS